MQKPAHKCMKTKLNESFRNVKLDIYGPIGDHAFKFDSQLTILTVVEYFHSSRAGDKNKYAFDFIQRKPILFNFFYFAYNFVSISSINHKNCLFIYFRIGLAKHQYISQQYINYYRF